MNLKFTDHQNRPRSSSIKWNRNNICTKHRIRGLLVTRVAPLTFRACNSPKVLKFLDTFPMPVVSPFISLCLSVLLPKLSLVVNDIGETVLKVTIYTNNPNTVICTLNVSCREAKFSGLECCTKNVGCKGTQCSWIKMSYRICTMYVDCAMLRDTECLWIENEACHMYDAYKLYHVWGY